jgi:hypothetical protein
MLLRRIPGRSALIIPHHGNVGVERSAIADPRVPAEALRPGHGILCPREALPTAAKMVSATMVENDVIHTDVKNNGGRKKSTLLPAAIVECDRR